MHQYKSTALGFQHILKLYVYEKCNLRIIYHDSQSVINGLHSKYGDSLKIRII